MRHPNYSTREIPCDIYSSTLEDIQVTHQYLSKSPYERRIKDIEDVFASISYRTGSEKRL